MSIEKETPENELWSERLIFYTSKMEKNKVIETINYVAWVKCKAILEEAEEIKKLIP